MPSVPLRVAGAMKTFARTALPLALLATTACSGAAPAFGPARDQARTAAHEFFGAIALRFTNPQRSPKAVYARRQFGKYSLTPSAIYNDSALWTRMDNRDSIRLLLQFGEFAGGRYTLTPRTTLPAPDSPGDSRHTLQLRRLSGSEFEWNLGNEFAVGRVRPTDFAQVLGEIPGSAEGKQGPQIKAEFRTQLPRTFATLGDMFAVDTVRALHDTEGGTTTSLVLRITPDRLRGEYPAFADYLEKYARTTRINIVATDARGAKWFELAGANNLFRLRIRSRGGRFAPLDAPVRPLPEMLFLRSDFTTKIGIFTVGWANMRSELSILKSEKERGWLFRFPREPEWRLPLGTRRLIKTPLRRPFMGGGAQYRIVVTESAEGQTTITRRALLVVQESAILRFINRLGARATGDFFGKTEADEARFFRDVFSALQSDVTALLH